MYVLVIFFAVAIKCAFYRTYFWGGDTSDRVVYCDDLHLDSAKLMYPLHRGRSTYCGVACCCSYVRAGNSVVPLVAVFTLRPNLNGAFGKSFLFNDLHAPARVLTLDFWGWLSSRRFRFAAAVR